MSHLRYILLLFFSFFLFLLVFQLKTSPVSAVSIPTTCDQCVARGGTCDFNNVQWDSTCRNAQAGQCGWNWGYQYEYTRCIGGGHDGLNAQTGKTQSCCADPSGCPCSNTCSSACQGDPGWDVVSCTGGSQCVGWGGNTYCHGGSTPARYCQSATVYCCIDLNRGNPIVDLPSYGCSSQSNVCPDGSTAYPSSGACLQDPKCVPPTPIPTTPPPPPPSGFSCSLSTTTAAQSNCGNSGDYCVRISVSYSGSYSTPVSQNWNFGNGSGVNDSTYVTYRNYTRQSSNRNYTITLNANGGSSTSCSRTITVTGTGSTAPTTPPGGGGWPPYPDCELYCHSWGSTCKSGYYYQDARCPDRNGDGDYDYYQQCNNACPVSQPNPPSTPTRTPTSGGGGGGPYVVSRCISNACTQVISSTPASNECSILSPCSGGPAQPTPTTPAGGTYQILAGVYIDANNNGTRDTNEEKYGGTVVVLRRGNGTFVASQTTSNVPGPAYGLTSFLNNSPGEYILQYEVPEGYVPSNNGSNTHTIQLTAPWGDDELGIIPATDEVTTIITGTILENTTGECTLTDSSPVSGATITINSPTAPNPWSGTSNASGVYTISVTDDPNNTNNHYISLSNIDGRTICGVSIDNGPVIPHTNSTYGPFDFTTQNNIQFILNTSTPWFMTSIGSVRQQSIQNSVPGGQLPTLLNDSSSVFYSTVQNAQLGAASTNLNLWIVDSEYDQVPAIKREGNASFSFYKNRAAQNGVELTALPGCTLNGNCNYTGNPNALNNKTIYYVNGNLTFTPSQPFIAPEKTLIFLAEGNITIDRDVKLYKDKSLVIFAAKEDLIITPNVGTTNLSAAPVVTSNSSTYNLQAILTAEDDIIIQSNANCSATPDRRLNIEGSLVANADNPFGVENRGDESKFGELIQERTLCASNSQYPALYVQSRLGFITALTDFYKVSNTFWNEVAP